MEIVKAGANVILDWGFWTRDDRKNISDFFESHSVLYEWHYVDVQDTKWQIQIEERNRRIEEGNGGSDFYLDEGLMNKLLSVFEEPGKDEMDVWHINK